MKGLGKGKLSVETLVGDIKDREINIKIRVVLVPTQSSVCVCVCVRVRARTCVWRRDTGSPKLTRKFLLMSLNFENFYLIYPDFSRSLTPTYPSTLSHA